MYWSNSKYMGSWILIPNEEDSSTVPVHVLSSSFWMGIRIIIFVIFDFFSFFSFFKYLNIPLATWSHRFSSFESKIQECERAERKRVGGAEGDHAGATWRLRGTSYYSACACINLDVECDRTDEIRRWNRAARVVWDKTMDLSLLSAHNSMALELKLAAVSAYRHLIPSFLYLNTPNTCYSQHRW